MHVLFLKMSCLIRVKVLLKVIDVTTLRSLYLEQGHKQKKMIKKYLYFVTYFKEKD